MNAIVEIIRFYLQHFHVEDYLLLFACATLFFGVIFLAVFLRQRPALAAFVLILAFVATPVAYAYGSAFINDKFRARELQVTSGQVLVFSRNIYFHVRLKNLSERDFSICRVHINLLEKSYNYLEEFVSFLRPLAHYEVNLRSIRAGAEAERELVLPYYLKAGKKFRSYARAVCF